MGNPTAFQGAGGLHTAWATNPFSTYGNKLSCSGSAFPWPCLKHYHPGIHRLSSKVASTIIFSRPEGRAYRRSPCSSANPEKKTKKTHSMRQIRRICTAFACPEVHSSSEIQLNFLHNNFQFCHINVTRSSSFDLNPTPHKSKIPKLPKSEEKVFAYELVSFVNSVVTLGGP